MKSILILTSSIEPLVSLREMLDSGYEIETVVSYDECSTKLQRRRFDMAFIEISFLEDKIGEPIPAAVFEAKYAQLRKTYPLVPIVVMGPQTEVGNLVQAVRSGANRYLTTPLDQQAVLYAINRLQERVQIHSELEYLRSSSWADDKLGVTKTHSPVMAKVFEEIHSVATADSTILLLGESGVGKGVMAKLIHRNSPRSKGPFVHVHSGAIPDNLIESELFGHEKGAFTGASQRKLGRFEIAKGGTIFLDEIGTISPSTQTKLLQVLQDDILTRVGGESTIETDVRVIAATNEDLLAMSHTGSFREDLYYRLNVFPITVPPLRERLEDVPLLVNNFIEKLEAKYRKQLQGIDNEVLEALQAYDFPGNIREMENILERAYVLETSNSLTLEALPKDLSPHEEKKREIVLSPGQVDTSLALTESRRKVVDQFEYQYITQLLTDHRGHVTASAAKAGITDRQLRKLMRKHNLPKENFK